jgi:FKBP-type peptidyl-prolyl cis-trans isomerase
MKKLTTIKQLMKLSKEKLLLKLKKEFAKKIDALPKRKLAEYCYNMAKAGLPQLKTIKQKALPKKKTKKKTKKKKKAGTYTAKNGRKYKILASGQARFI